MVLESRRGIVVRASSSPDSTDPSDPIAPLRMESPTGQFLSQILISHPHLVPAAVEQQLKQLQTEWDTEQKKEELSASGTDLVLYRRIAEVKANERKRALEEILYALVVQKFMDADVSLVPAITPSSKNSSGQVYAASVMYGYFLKRVDERFQLEKTMKILPNGSDSEGSSIEKAVREDIRSAGDYLAVSSHLEVSSWSGGFGNRIKPSRLRTYLMSFDGDTLQRFATIRSKEAVSIIEKQTEALFGRPEIVLTPQGTVDSSKDELIKISFGGLRKLVLEAITFGSFLWDGESFVDSRYHFVMN
ncbi:hypothetical protein Gotri_025355 [Gossypium trilobum]|uniref:UV-B-induced protein At3g17800, chloroplastic-like n=1 Tax=Gossypium trilobum TaxID=34281 RepID=A0A7J9FK40_9ROSI|nr:hypothetical protein [Gossypium trilobum]